MAVPNPGDDSGITLDEVYALFREFLGRDPDWATEGNPRVGSSRVNTYYDIRCSEEAANYRTNHGAEPDFWCGTHDRNGNPIVFVPPPTVQPPPVSQPPSSGIPSVGIPGIDGALRWLADVLGQKIADARAASDAALKHVQEETDKIVSKALPAIQHAAQNLQTQLATTVADLIPNTLALLSTGLGGIGNLISTFLSNSADIGDIGDVIVNVIKDHETPLGDFVHNAFGSAFGAGIQFALLALLPKVEGDHPVRGGLEKAVGDYVAHLGAQVNG